MHHYLQRANLHQLAKCYTVCKTICRTLHMHKVTGKFKPSMQPHKTNSMRGRSFKPMPVCPFRSTYLFIRPIFDLLTSSIRLWLLYIPVSNSKFKSINQYHSFEYIYIHINVRPALTHGSLRIV